MPSLLPVDHDPFAGDPAPAFSLVPVDHDPHAGEPGGVSFAAVDHDPWEAAAERTRQSVLSRHEGRATQIGEALGARAIGMPIGLAQSAVRGVMAPGQAYRGELSEDQYIPRALDMAGLVMGGGVGGTGASAGRALGSGPLFDERYMTRWNPLDQADVYKELALARKNKHGGGSTVRVYDNQAQIDKARGGGLEKGSWQEDIARAKADFDNALATKRADFQDATNPYLTKADREFLASKDFALGSGATDKRGAALIAGAEGATQPTGIRAYHGSPHDFDRFDLSKIGTGEGAQAYGHGLYFAENEGVARNYRDALAKPYIGGKLVDETNPTHIAASYLEHYKGDRESALKDLLDPTNSRWWSPEELQTANAAADLIRGGSALPKAELNKGRMYEVNINADPAHFLDWDKPLAGQSRPLSALQGIVPPAARQELLEAVPQGVTGEHVYQHLIRPQMGAEQGTAALREAGVPGIRYLDQGSRGAIDTNNIRGSLSMWEGALRKTPKDPYAQQQVADLRNQLAQAESKSTRNYVVFDDKLIDILRKYGLAGLSMVPPAVAAEMKTRLVPVDHDPFAQQ